MVTHTLNVQWYPKQENVYSCPNQIVSIEQSCVCWIAVTHAALTGDVVLTEQHFTKSFVVIHCVVDISTDPYIKLIFNTDECTDDIALVDDIYDHLVRVFLKLNKHYCEG